MPHAAGPAERPERAVVEYVLKVASRCNLACDHCYVYGDPERGWLSRPTTMDPATARAAAWRIREHAERHGQARVAVILHGGEPLLLGVAGLARIISELSSVIEPAAELDLRLQSNGILLTREMCQLLAVHHVKVGISLDGDVVANDRHRLFVNGASSHDQVLRALTLLRTPPFRALYGGILCTVDVANDPVCVYDAIRREEPPRIDFLLPHATWDSPPPGPSGGYADWLLTIYDRWTADGRPVPIRIFDSIHALRRGDPSGTEALGSDTGAVGVIETDGTWEQVDSLKTVSEKAPRTGLDVRRHSVDEFAALAAALRRDGGTLPQLCRSCPVVDTCGGGLYAHRFGLGNDFANPSVYCVDLRRLITDVRSKGSIGTPAGPRSPLRGDDVRDLASSSPTREALGRLSGMRHAIDCGLLKRALARSDSELGRAAWDLLSEIGEEQPAEVQRVLSSPFVRIRALACLAADAPKAAEASTALLTAVAAAAAVRTGSEAAIDVLVDNGTLCLPGVGTLDVADARTVVVSVDKHPGTFEARPDRGAPRVLSIRRRRDPEWRPIRIVDVGGATPLRLEDADPRRDCFPLPVCEPLSAAEADRWSDALGQAWAAVRADAPGLAAAMDALVTTVVPIRLAPHRRPRATTARSAFGAVAMPLVQPNLLSSLLVEQVAHLTVAAVHDLCDLLDADHVPAGPRSAGHADAGSGRVGVSRLADAFGRAASLQLMAGRVRAGTQADHAEVSQLRESLVRRVDALDRGGRWTESGRLLVAGLRRQVDQVAIA